MTVPTSSCDWEIDEPPEGCRCSVLEELEPERQALFKRMATDLLWSWTGRKFGLCTETVRPCRAECAPRNSTFWGPNAGSTLYQDGYQGWLPFIFAGQWWNVGCGSCGPQCSCTPDVARSLALPGVPHNIVSVWIAGEELPSTAYELRDGILYRIDGGTWPWCNDDIADAHTPDSAAWEITYRRGIPAPVGGQVAAYRLACELAKAACEDDTCQLPDNVRSVTRQGVSIDLTTTEFSEIKDGRTGIWLIDSWVASINAPQAVPARVYSPDIEPGRGRGTMAGLGRGRTRTW